jgi:FkbH-like protein
VKSCRLQLSLFTPSSDTEKKRCFELVQRSNQLNLTGRHYAIDDLENFWADKQHVCLGVRCRDRLGDYGTIGFMVAHNEGDTCLLKEFVLSCRVARKYCEAALLRWLFVYAKNQRQERLCVNLVKTGRNGPLIEVLRETPLLTVGQFDQDIRFELPCSSDWPDEGIVEVSEG